ncbi:MAG TPA: ribonuclease T [Sphingomonas sp.]
MRFLMLLAILLLPASVLGQTVRRPHADLPGAEQPARRVPITGYTLALSWAPEYCHAPAHRAADECVGAARRGFTLHGLWPDGGGPDKWPQYCKPVAILTDAEIAAGIAATPSPQLMQHEWAKHGSCFAPNATAFFATEDALFRAVRLPDMAMLAHRRGLTVAAFQSAFAAANPGMRGDMMRLDVNRSGWLEEVWLCLGLDKQPRACPADAGGADPDTALKVQAPS